MPIKSVDSDIVTQYMRARVGEWLSASNLTYSVLTLHNVDYNTQSASMSQDATNGPQSHRNSHKLPDNVKN